MELEVVLKMSQYKTILAALDLIKMEESPVVKKAKSLASLYGAKLHLIHVVERLYTYGTPPFPTDINDWQREFEEAAGAKMEKLGDHLGVPQNYQTIVSGNPKEEILEEADKIGADLIIVGSHSRQGLSYMLLGSSASGVVNAATCDVLVIKVQTE